MSSLAKGKTDVKPSDRQAQRAQKFASIYLKRGWQPVPYRTGTKGPRADGWQHWRFAPEEIPHHFRENVGVLLGEPSGGLVDLDLDCHEAAKVAHRFMPPTNMRFGRESAPGRHWEYVCDPLPKTAKFTDPIMSARLRGKPKSEEKAAILEIRASGQTMFPPSIHPSGERVRWEDTIGIGRTSGEALHRGASRTAAAVLLGRYWPGKGARHNAAVALAGGLLRLGWSEEEARAFLEAVADVAEDEETTDRLQAVVSTAKKQEKDEPTVGWRTLAEYVEKKAVFTAAKWLGYRDEKGGSGKKPTPAEIGQALTDRYDFICVYERLYVYQDGYYQPHGVEIAQKAVQDYLGKQARKNDGTEVVYWLSNECRVPPDELDKAPSGRFLVNVSNGLLDPLEGKLYRHTPKYLSIIQLPVRWDPNAYHQRLDQFLNEVLPSKETRLLLEEAIGYCLLPNMKYQKAVMLLGEGENGKSVFLSMLRAMLGDRNTATIPLQDFGSNRFAAYGLVGKLANIFPDLPQEALRDTGVFKALVSGDPIAVERKHANAFSYTSRAKLFFSANELPRTNDKTYAFFRRWIIVPFPYRFGPGEVRKADPALLDKITTPDALSYLLLLAVKGLQRLMERGRFTETPETREASERYQYENNSVFAFVKDACRIGPKATEEKAALYQAYCRWCELHGVKPVNEANFAKRLHAVVRGLQETRPRAKGKRVRMYSGLRLIDDELIDWVKIHRLHF